MADLREGLPFKKESFEVVWASHILEHIPDLRGTQRELARVIKTGGELQIIVPYYLSPDAWGDPTHCRGFSQESFQSCYWVGFIVTDIQVKEYIKRWMETKVHWLHVTLRRDSTEYWEVKAALSGNNFQKT